MAKSPAFQFYAQDFLVGVMGMADEEVGTYIKMLAFQWDRGGLPSDPKAIRLAIGSRKVPSQNVMSKFKLGDDGQLRNARLEVERAKQEAYRESRVDAANKRWHKESKRNARALHKDMQNGMQTPMQNDALQSSSSSSDKSSKEDLSPCKSPKGDVHFLPWWEKYPKKVGKAKARAAWIKAGKRIRLERQCSGAEAVAHMQEAVEAFSVTPKALGPYCPNPATWLNGGNYDDDRATWELPQTTAANGSPERYTVDLDNLDLT